MKPIKKSPWPRITLALAIIWIVAVVVFFACMIALLVDSYRHLHGAP